MTILVGKRTRVKVEVDIKGEWLKNALDAQGDSVSDAARRIGLSAPRMLHMHIQGKSLLGSRYLAILAQQYPTMNIRYVLTGIGSPVQASDADVPVIQVPKQGLFIRPE